MPERDIDKLLDEIEAHLSDAFIYAAVLDENAKLVNFRKGKRVRFDLPSEDRQQTIAVQISLTFTILRQFEDITGDHRYALVRFSKNDVLLINGSDLHLFVIIRSIDSMSQVTRLLEIVDRPAQGNSSSKAAGNSPPVPSTGPTMPKSRTMPRVEAASEAESEPVEPRTESITYQSKLPRPEAIIMLQGFLKGFEFGFTIESGSELASEGGYYKVKANETNGFPWAMIEKINLAFGSQIVIHSITKDSDGKLAIKISLKEASNNIESIANSW